MAMWKDEHEKALVKLLKKAKDEPDAYKHIGDLGKEFRKGQPYNSRCTKCEAETFTDARILNKARKIVTQANKLDATKDKLAIPPTRERYKELKNNTQSNNNEPKKDERSKEQKLADWING